MLQHRQSWSWSSTVDAVEIAVEIAAVVVYRYYTASLFPNDSTLVLVVSTVGSSVLGAIFLVIMGQV